MISETAIQLLIDKLGKENVITAAEDLLVLGYDSTPGLHATPDLVVYPTDSEQVQSVMQVARDHKLPITPRGSGTGLSGGSIPINGGIVICLNKMNMIYRLTR